MFRLPMSALVIFGLLFCVSASGNEVWKGIKASGHFLSFERFVKLPPRQQANYLQALVAHRSSLYQMIEPKKQQKVAYLQRSLDQRNYLSLTDWLNKLFLSTAYATNICKTQSEAKGSLRYLNAYCVHAGYESKYKCYPNGLFCQSVDLAKNASPDHALCKSPNGIGNRKALACNPAIYGHDFAKKRVFCVIQGRGSSAKKCGQLQAATKRTFNLEGQSSYYYELASFYAEPNNIGLFGEFSNQLADLEEKLLKYCENQSRQAIDCQNMNKTYSDMKRIKETIDSGFRKRVPLNPHMATNDYHTTDGGEQVGGDQNMAGTKNIAFGSSHKYTDSFLESRKKIRDDRLNFRRGRKKLRGAIKCTAIKEAERKQYDISGKNSNPASFIEEFLADVGNEAEGLRGQFKKGEKMEKFRNKLKQQSLKTRTRQQNLAKKYFDLQVIHGSLKIGSKDYSDIESNDFRDVNGKREKITPRLNDALPYKQWSNEEDARAHYRKDKVARKKLASLIARDTLDSVIAWTAFGARTKEEEAVKNASVINKIVSNISETSKTKASIIQQSLERKGLDHIVREIKPLRARCAAGLRNCDEKSLEVYRVTVQPAPLSTCLTKVLKQKYQQYYYVRRDKKKNRWVIYETEVGFVHHVNHSASVHKAKITRKHHGKISPYIEEVITNDKSEAALKQSFEDQGGATAPAKIQTVSATIF